MEERRDGRRNQHGQGHPAGSERNNPARLTELDGTLFFEAVDGTHGRELWKSDGTDAGTMMIKDIRPGARGSTTHAYYGLEKLGIKAGRVYLAANDGIHGFELWTSDGTAAGTVMLKDTHRGYWGSNPESFTDVGGELFFVSGSRIWKSDGTGAGTIMVKNVPGDQLGYLPDVAGALYFVSSEHLWRSDGTRAGTVIVKDVFAVQWLTVVDWILYFAGAEYFADTGSAGDYELWRSDGTTAGTVVVKKINPTRIPLPSWLTDVGGTLYFGASDGTHGYELWKSDGTDAGTILVKDTRPGSASPTWLTDVGGTLYFIAKGDSARTALWTSDGTEAGTVLVKDIRVGWRRYLRGSPTRMGRCTSPPATVSMASSSGRVTRALRDRHGEGHQGRLGVIGAVTSRVLAKMKIGLFSGVSSNRCFALIVSAFVLVASYGMSAAESSAERAPKVEVNHGAWRSGTSTRWNYLTRSTRCSS